MSRALGRISLGAASLLVVLVLLTPASIGLSSPAPSAPSDRSPPAVAAGPHLPPRPASWTCPPANLLPTYSYVNGFAPPVPAQGPQTCGNSVDQDTIHATFSSPHNGSAERFTEPIYLPTTGAPGPSFAYNDFELGMVVGGDPASAYRQSYVELYFTPNQAGANATVTWSISLAVWSMHNYSANGVGLGGCWNASLVVWNNSYWCTDDMMNTTLAPAQLGPSGIAGGTWYNVTFDGVKGGSKGLTIWANDTTDPVSANNYSATLNSTTTNTTTFEPYFNSSCVDACFLNWSFPYGLGIGWDLCPVGSPLVAPCDSYNQTTWDGIPSPAFGTPLFWQNASAGYGGQYEYVAVVSGSAECNSPAIPVASCGVDFNAGGGTGFYPYFSWNGSALNFGDTTRYTLEDMGGRYYEYITTGPYQHDIVPTFLDSISNDSHGGYIRPGHALNVTAHVSDLGTIAAVHLNYTLNSGAVTTLAMPLTSGTAQRGAYSAEIPVGANGYLNYTVTAVSNAPARVVSTTYHVFRGPLPVFTLTVNTLPPRYTNLTVNGTLAHNATQLSLNPGTYPINSTSIYPFVFSRYATTGGASVPSWNGTGGDANLTVSGNGEVDAQWVYVRPHVTVHFDTDPSGCGSATISNATIPNGGSFSVLYGFPQQLGALQGCGGKSFAGWTFVGNFTVLGSTLTPNGNGTLIANFALTSAASALTFYTTPSNCGAVLYRGAGYTYGETLEVNSTPYPISSVSCHHYGFQQFNTTGGVSISNGNLTVTSSGSVTAVDYVLTEVTVLSFPAYCNVTIDGVTYGNGSVVVVANHSAHTASQNSCGGHYPFNLDVTPGLTLFGDVLTVNTSGNLFATWLPGSTPSEFVEFETDPGSCGAIYFENESRFNTNFTNVDANTTTNITALACANYGFVRWEPTGGIAVPARYNASATVYINSSGSLEAVYRPDVSVAVETTPTGCGTVVVNGVDYTNNGSLTLTEDVAYPVQAIPCAHYSFVSWGNTIGAIVANGTIYLTGQSILTANFVLTQYNVTVLVGPKACGSIFLNGASETNGSVVTLTYGIYSVSTSPCVGDVVASVNASANLTLNGSHVTVSGNGTLSALYVPVPPSVTLSVPTGTVAGDAVEFTATVGVLVPPFTYNYTWAFGDGTSLTTPANFTEHTYSSPGTYRVTVVVHDPYNRTATTNETISVIAANPTGTAGVPESTLIILGIVGLAGVALIVAALWRRRPSTENAEAETPPALADTGNPEMSDGMAEAPPSDGQT